MLHKRQLQNNLVMKKVVFILVLSMFCRNVKSQTLFEDSSGESSYYLNYGPKGWIKFNSSSSSVSLGYNRKRGSGHDFPEIHNHNYILGANLTATVEKGIGTVFSEEKAASGIGAEFLVGLLSTDYLDRNKEEEEKANSLSSYYFKLGLANSKLSTIDTVNVKENSSNEWLYDVSLNLNFRLNKPYKKNDEELINYHFIGLAVGRKKVSNLETLKSVELQNIVINNGSMQVVKTTEGKGGELMLKSASYLFVDYGFTPNLFNSNQIGFNIYYRGNYGGFKSVNNLGIGTFFSKENEPQGILGGIALQFNDLNNNLQSENTLYGRSTIFFYVGYSL